MRPRILVTLDLGETLRRGVPFPMVELKAAYASAVERAGGIPILAAPTVDPDVVAELGDLFDGLLLTGGAFDIDPAVYGETPSRGVRIDPPKPLRTQFELALFEIAQRRQRPVLGICGGMQLINVALGGTLIKDILTEVPGALDHEQATSPATSDHRVMVEPESRLAAIVGKETITVNTTHHQAIARLAPGLRVSGRAPDGVIEAIEHRDLHGLLGVQWHPELLDDDTSRALYAAWIDSAR